MHAPILLLPCHLWRKLRWHPFFNREAISFLAPRASILAPFFVNVKTFWHLFFGACIFFVPAPSVPDGSQIVNLPGQPGFALWLPLLPFPPILAPFPLNVKTFWELFFGACIFFAAPWPFLRYKDCNLCAKDHPPHGKSPCQHFWRS